MTEAPEAQSSGGRSHRTIAEENATEATPPRFTVGHLVKDVGGVTLYGAGPKLVGAMSRRQIIRLAERLGDLVRRASPGDAGMLRDELRRTLGDDLPVSADELVRRAFRNRMLNELEVLRYPALGPHNVSATAVVEGREHLDAVLARGKGAVIMIGHYGANQMIMPALGYAGYKMNQISAPPTAWLSIRTDGRVNPLFKRVQEQRWELEKALPTQHIDVFGFMRPAYECLERNEVLGLACDGGGGSRWLPMPLGDRTAWVPTQPWQLARTTGAMVVPTRVVRDGRQTAHRVILEEPFEVPKTRKKREDVADAVVHFGERLTSWIRERPDHYLPYLLLRIKVRGTDARPYFDDYPEG